MQGNTESRSFHKKSCYSECQFQTVVNTIEMNHLRTGHTPPVSGKRMKIINIDRSKKIPVQTYHCC